MPCLLGIDPGSRITGFGILRMENRHVSYLNCGCIRTQDKAIALRLKTIFHNLSEIIEAYKPDVLAIEKVFVSKNADAALKLGQARGAAIVAAVQHDIPVFEYSPNAIKQAIVGRGHADKAQVQHMIKILLKLSAIPQVDAADALAVALCHAHTQQHQGYVNAALKG